MTFPVQFSIGALPGYIAAKASRGRVFVPSGPVEPIALFQAFQDNQWAAEYLIFVSLSLPGINTTDWSELHPSARAEVFFPTPERAASIATGKTRLLSLHYRRIYDYLSQVEIKVALFHVCTPDDDGMCSLSLSSDASPAFFARDIVKIGLINSALPPMAGAPKIHVSQFDCISHIEQPALTMPAAAVSDQSLAIAHHVAMWVDDGATLQAGIGKLPNAVMGALYTHKNLRLHSGLIGDWALGIDAAGAWASHKGSLVAGVVLGSQKLHEALRDDDRLSLRPICDTHGVQQLAGLDRFTSINAALEIDLFGQINCEFVDDSAIASVGGAVDFLRAARASHRGRPIIMIQSQGKNKGGQEGVSRIVPRLKTPCVSIARTDAPILVTEHGAIDLEPLDAQARARAIISLADPRHHESLTQAWQQISR